MTGPIFNAGAIEATASIDRTQFIRDLKQMQLDIAEFQRNEIKLGVVIDKESAKSQLRALVSELSNSDIKLSLGIDPTRARSDVNEFKNYVRNTGTTDVPIVAKLDKERIKSDLRSLVAELSTTTNDIKLTLGISVANAKKDVEEFRRVVKDMPDIKVDIGVNFDKAAIRTELMALKNELSSSDAAKFNIGPTPRPSSNIQAAQTDAQTQTSRIRREISETAILTATTTPIGDAVPTRPLDIPSPVIKDPAPYKLTADSTPLDIQIAKEYVKLEELQAKKFSPELDLKIEKLIASRDQAIAKLAELQRMQITPEATVKMVSLFADLGKARAELDDLNAKRANPEADLKIAALQAGVAQSKIKLQEIDKQRVNPEINLLYQKSQEALDRTNRQLDILSHKTATPEIDAAIEKFQDKKASIEETMRALDGLRANPKLDADAAILEAKIALDENKIRTLDAMKANPKFDAQADVLESKIETITQQIHRLDVQTANSKWDLDIKAGLVNVDVINQKIAEFERQRSSAKLDVEIVSALSNIQTLESKREEFNAKEAKIKAEADVAGALGGLQSVESARRELNGKEAKVDVKVGNGINDLRTRTIAVIAALEALIYFAPAAAIGIVGIGAAGVTAAQGLATFKLGLSGVSELYKALETQEHQPIKMDNISNAGILSAQRAVDAARLSSARTASSAAETIQQAQQSEARNQITSSRTIENAIQSEQRTTITSAKAIADAKISEEQVIRTTAQSIATAENTLKDAQLAGVDAANKLVEARAQEILNLEDLQLKLRGASLTEDEAATALKQAVEHLRVLNRDPLATPLQLEQANEAIKRAQLTVDESKQSYKEVGIESAKAAQTGVDGSASVVAAQDAVNQANQKTADAQTSLTNAQLNGQDQLAKAAEATASAIDNGLYNNQKAAESTATAIDDARYSQEQAANAVTKAIEAQTDSQLQSSQTMEAAQQRVVDAQTTAANAGIRAFNAVAVAESEMSKEAIAFGHFLYDDVQPAIKGIQAAAGSEMLPRFTTALTTLLQLQPEIQTGMKETGKTIGNLAIEGANMATSGPFKKDFADIMHTNSNMLGDFGRSGLLVVDSARSIYAVSLPLLETFSLWVNKSALLFDSWIQGKRASGELGQFMQTAGERAKELWDFLVKLATAIYDLAKAWEPVGGTFIGIVEALASMVSWLDKVSPQLLTMIGYGIALKVGYEALTPVFNGITTSVSNIGNSIVNFTTKAGASEATVGKVTAAADKFAGTVSKIGNALPILGGALIALDVIWSSAITSLDDGAQAMLKGGKAAEEMTAKVDDQLTGFGKWLNGVGNWITGGHNFVATSDDMRKRVNELRDAMTPLERATSDVTRAQNDYILTIDKYGRDSPQALDAQNKWKDATQRATDETDKQRHALITDTDAMAAQRDEMLGNLGAEIRFKDGVAQLTRGVQEHGKSVDLDTQSGRDNVRALNDNAKAAADHLTQMQKDGVGVDQVTTKAEEYKKSLYNQAIQIGYTKDAAQQYVDKLGLIPPNKNTDVTVNIADATNQLQDYINRLNVVKNLGPLQTVVNFQQELSTFYRNTPPPRAIGGIDFKSASSILGMADGGILGMQDTRVKAMSMSTGVANIIAPNTPTLMGDNKQFSESYIPHDPSSTRAQSIFDITGKALGRTVLPQDKQGTQDTSMQHTGITSPKAIASALQPDITTSTQTSLSDQKAYNSTFATSNIRSDTNNTTNNVNNSRSTNVSDSKPVSNIDNSSSQMHDQVAIQNSSNGTTIGTVVMQIPYGASPKEYVEELDFHLQYHRKKGVYRK